ncbi:MAG: hypothetical protein ACFFCS_06045 [Candidatus Hodarchaeota archaeon]
MQSTDQEQFLNYGLLLDQEVIFANSPEFEFRLQIIIFANSFAANMVDGSLSRIDHENDGMKMVTLIHDKVLSSGQHLFYVISGFAQSLQPFLRNQLLEKYVQGVDSNFDIEHLKEIKEGNPPGFATKMNKIMVEIDQDLLFILKMQTTKPDTQFDDGVLEIASIYYIGISTQGLPVVNHLYGSKLTSRFKLPAKEDTSPEEVLRSLISAQFSAIQQSCAINARTVIKDLSIKYNSPITNEAGELSITFFPVGYKDQFTFEVCYDGTRKEIEDFVKSASPLLNQFIDKPFRGNLADFQPVAGVLASYPDRFGFFGYDKEERKTQVDDDDDDDDIVIIGMEDIKKKDNFNF